MPATKLEVKIVGAKEWNAVVKSSPRYEYVDDDTMGFADPQSGKAYVRQTYWPDLNRYLLQHEFEHLLEEAGTDEDVNGVRHKKFFKQILAPALKVASIAAAPFTGGLSLLAAPALDVGIAAQEGQRGLGRTALQSYGTNVLGGGGGAALGGQFGTLGAGLGGGLGGGIAGALTGTGAGQGAIIGGLGGLGQSGLGSFATGTPNVGRNAAISAGTAGIGQGLTGGLPGGVGLQGVRAPVTQTLSAATPAQSGIGLQTIPSTPSVSSLGTGISGGPLAPLQRFTSGLGAGLSNIGSLFGGGGGGGGGSPPPGAGGRFTPTLAGYSPTYLNSVEAAALRGQPGFSELGTAGRGMGSYLGGLLGPAALGIGIGALGQTRPGRPPSVPELSQLPSVQQFAQQSQAGFGPLLQQLAPLTQQLGNLQNLPLPAGLQSAVTRPFEEERTALHSRFGAIQPGVDLGTVSGRGSLNYNLADVAQRQSEALARETLGFQANQRQNIEAQRQNILTQAGVTQDQLASYQQLAQLDIDTIMARTGLRAEQASQFKQLFGTLGATVAGAGILNNFRV